MKILALADEECPALYDYYTPGKLKDYDLIISCGDLKANYLSFIVVGSLLLMTFTGLDRFVPMLALPGSDRVKLKKETK